MCYFIKFVSELRSVIYVFQYNICSDYYPCSDALAEGYGFCFKNDRAIPNHLLRRVPMHECAHYFTIITRHAYIYRFPLVHIKWTPACPHKSTLVGSKHARSINIMLSQHCM